MTGPYHDGFFDAQSDRALRSARVIAPVIAGLLHPARVVDVGCGRGAWLKAFQEAGATSIAGFDGAYVDRARLLIDPTAFTPADLAHPPDLGRHDLAICLEVAEHLPPRSARPLIRALTTAAPAVLFSAAIPGQTGTRHVHERWPWYWEELFGEFGFQRLDPVRRRLRDDQRVEWWYRQNTSLYVSRDVIAQDPALREEAQNVPPALEWVHVGVLMRFHTLPGLIVETSRRFWYGLRRSVGSR
jgi:hypothetical protein